ncbi:hypothetical protein ABIC32_001451 [Brevundimonas sp. 1080]|uniref:DUF2274 domain-containing protein n=1 Tax=Brevundimonas sp. 1080 TaxID=3156405 RepID=UPI00339657BA
MSTLKLAGLQDDTPVKLTLELPAEIHRDLVLYAELLASADGANLAPQQLVGPMLSRFMATDRSFAAQKARFQTRRTT